MNKYYLKDNQLIEYGTASKASWFNFSYVYKLTTLEKKMLMLLANNIVNTFEEIEKFVYNNSKYADNERICAVIYRLKKKYNLKIKNINRCGYRLDSEIYIDY